MDWINRVQIEITHHSFSQSLFRKIIKQMSKYVEGCGGDTRAATSTTHERGRNQNLEHKTLPKIFGF